MIGNFQSLPCVLTADDLLLSSCNSPKDSFIELSYAQTSLLLPDAKKMFDAFGTNFFCATIPPEKLIHYSDKTVSSISQGKKGCFGTHHGFVNATDDPKAMAMVNIALNNFYRQIYDRVEKSYFSKIQAMYDEWNRREQTMYSNVSTILNDFFQEFTKKQIESTIQTAIQFVSRVFSEKNFILCSSESRHAYLNKTIDMIFDVCKIVNSLVSELNNLFLPNEINPYIPNIPYLNLIWKFTTSRKAIEVYTHLNLIELLLTGAYIDSAAIETRCITMNNEIFTPLANAEKRLVDFFVNEKQKLENWFVCDVSGQPLIDCMTGKTIKVYDIAYIDMLLNKRVVDINSDSVFRIIDDVKQELNCVCIKPIFTKFKDEENNS